jgi:hypothetical protein
MTAEPRKRRGPITLLCLAGRSRWLWIVATIAAVAVIALTALAIVGAMLFLAGPPAGQFIYELEPVNSAEP